MGTLSANLSASFHLCLSRLDCSAVRGRRRWPWRSRRKSIIGCSLRQSSCPPLSTLVVRLSQARRDMALIPRTSKVVKASRSTAREKEGRERAGPRQPTGNIRFLDSLSLSLPLPYWASVGSFVAGMSGRREASICYPDARGLGVRRRFPLGGIQVTS